MPKLGTNIPKLVCPATMRVTYDFLRHAVFSGCAMPDSATLKFRAKKMHDLGDYRWWTRTIGMREDVNKVQSMLKIMAHEMIHVLLDHSKEHAAHQRHSRHFKALAAIICHEMGWPKGSV